MMLLILTWLFGRRNMLLVLIWLGLAGGASSQDIVMQEFTETLQITQSEELAYEDTLRYQSLMSSYTELLVGTLELDPSANATTTPPEVIDSSCKVNDQNLALLYSKNGTYNMLTISFTMRYDGYNVDEYPTLLQEYINANLESVAEDMQSRFLPVSDALEVVKVGELIAPTDLPTQRPSPSPISPTQKPSPSPVSSPSKSPSLPTEKPTMTKRTYAVPSQMILYHLADKLEGDAMEAWIDVTQDRIHDATSNILGEDGDGLVVNVAVDDQHVLESRRMLARHHDALVAIRSETPRHHHLRKLQSSQLQIDFNTTIEFNSERDDWAPNKMVASGFETADQTDEYFASLEAADNSSSFESLEYMEMEVAGQYVLAPSEETADEGGDDGSFLTGILSTRDDESDDSDDIPNKRIAALVIGVALLLMVCVLCRCYRKSKKSKSASTPQDQPRDESNKEDTDGDTSSNNNDEELDPVYSSIKAVAPPGKLGLVIANPHGETPVVLEMKEDSVLKKKVRVGDLLYSIDDIDCRGMQGSEISAMIASRSEAPKRTLLFLREQ